MKTSKFFLSTLIAAAAMTANAYADYVWDSSQDYTYTWDFSQTNTQNGATGVLGGTVTNTFVTEGVTIDGEAATAIKKGTSKGSYWEVNTNSFLTDALKAVTSNTIGTGTLTLSVDYYYTGAQWGETILHIGANGTGVAFGLAPHGYVSFVNGTASDTSFNEARTGVQLSANAWHTITWTITGNSWTASVDGGDASSGATVSNITWADSEEEQNKYSVGIKAPGWNEGVTGLNDSGCKIANLSVAYKPNLVWAEDVAGGIWDKSAASWKDGFLFADGDSVTFDTAGDVAVTVANDGVKAGTITVSAGTVTFSGGKVASTGGLTVGNGATLKLGTSRIGGNVTVNSGATFDLNGQSADSGSNGLGTITLAGGSLTNTGSSVDMNMQQLYALKLTADSTVSGTGNFGLISSDYGATTLDLGGHTLTKEGTNTFYVANTTISNGNLVVSAGTLSDGVGTQPGGKGVTLSGTTSLSVAGGATAKFDRLINNGSFTLSVAKDATAGLATIGSFTQNSGSVVVNGDTTIGSFTQNSGSVVVNGDTTITGNYRGSTGTNTNSSVSVNSGASLTVDGDFTLRHQNNYTDNAVGATMDVSGSVAVGGNLWIARDGKGEITINNGGTLSSNTVTFGQRWAGVEEKGSVVNVLTGGTFVAGSIVANTDINKDDGSDILNSSALNLKGGVFGTSSEALNVDVSAGSQALTIALGAGTTSTINTSKYENGAFGTTGAAISIANAISGDGVLDVTGAGTLTLSGRNTYAGGTEISGGTLKINSAAWGSKGNLGTAFGYDKLVLKNGGILEVTEAENKNAAGTNYRDGGAYRGFSVTEGSGTYRFSGTETSYLAHNDENQYIAIADDATLTFDVVQSGATLEVDKIIKGIGDDMNSTGGIVKTGQGALIVKGDNSNYIGGTTVSAGTLVAAHQNALGSGPLKLNGGTFGTSLGAFSVAGAVELGEGTTSTINLGKYTNGAFNNAETATKITITNAISGNGALTIVGNTDAGNQGQSLTLSGANTYTGGTTLNDARVIAKNASALGAGNLSMDRAEVQIDTDKLTVKNLNGSGTIMLGGNTTSSVLTIESTDDTTTFAGNLTSGSSDKTLDLVKTGAGTLSLTGTLVLNAVTVSEGALSVGVTSFGSDVTVGQGAELQVVANDGLGEYSSVDVRGNLNLATGSLLVVDLKDVKAAGETITLNIVSAEAISLNWNEQNAPLATADVPAIEGFVSIMGNEHLSDYVKQTWTLSGDTLSLTLAIPEPSLFGLLAGLGALTLVGTRRRRSKKA